MYVSDQDKELILGIMLTEASATTTVLLTSTVSAGSYS